MKKLTVQEIEDRLQTIDGWEYLENTITTTLEFKDFKDAFSIMTRIAFEAEAMQHHPEWLNIYNEVVIRLSTHDAGGVTEKDFQLAKKIEEIVEIA
ncbi:4a-hydroxytetrahydrobiopterin dehydratase [Zhouia sp. PK063]|uniref:4a-hydroxytetrahydrobiopterin dehydratase n=1 Tax=Zhouia sp. PK063 TaxID=3373602 RepID=UPI0037931B2D